MVTSGEDIKAVTLFGLRVDAVGDKYAPRRQKKIALLEWQHDWLDWASEVFAAGESEMEGGKVQNLTSENNQNERGRGRVGETSIIFAVHGRPQLPFPGASGVPFCGCKRGGRARGCSKGRPRLWRLYRRHLASPTILAFP